MSSAPSTGLSAKQRKVIVPRVWKRPHSTIYGKNVEYGSSLYSDKIGEINGRKFNSELPWQVRNSGSSSTSTGSTSQGYLSSLLNEPESTLIGSVLSPTTKYYPRFSATDDECAPHYCSNIDPLEPISGQRVGRQCQSYAHVLEATNPNRYSRRRNALTNNSPNSRSLASASNSNNNRNKSSRRIDFFENYLDFSNEINQLNNRSLLANEPLLRQSQFDKYLDFDNELGLFVPNYSNRQQHQQSKTTTGFNNNNNYSSSLASGGGGGGDDGRRSIRSINRADNDGLSWSGGGGGVGRNCHHLRRRDDDDQDEDGAFVNTRSSSSFVPITTTITKYGRTQLAPKHECQLTNSPYGQSSDGRKLSLGSINPTSYRPSLPTKTTTVSSSDGEQFEFHDRSSPFYTDRWAGKTIRHFDSDLYSNAGLFKSMLL